MLKQVELDPTFKLREQYADTSGDTTVLVNLFDVDPQDQAAFKDAWLIDANFFKAQPGYISTQLHQGIGNSRLFLNYAVFETTAAFASTNDQPQFRPLRGIYPDSATAHPHLFRRLTLRSVCAGDGDGIIEESDITAADAAVSTEALDPTCAFQQQLSETGVRAVGRTISTRANRDTFRPNCIEVFCRAECS